MLALVFDGKKAVLHEDYPSPRRASGEALIAVRMAGVCRTDLELLNGYMDFRGVMGHEFVGDVAEGPRKWLGKRIVADINCVCGRCDMCRRGLANHCRNRTVIGIDGRDGAFAQYIAVPVRNLHEVPDAVSDAEAVFVEPLAAAFQVAHQIKFYSAEKVVVLGDGRLGQLIVRVLKLSAAKPLLVGRHAAKLEAAEKQGIQTALADRFVPRNDADVVVDATGTGDGFKLAMRAVRPRGTIVLKSTFADEGGMNLTPLVINEVTVMGSRCGPFSDALNALAAGEVDVSALISGQFSLHEAASALDFCRKSDTIKVLIDVRR